MELLYYFFLTFFILFIIRFFTQKDKNLPPRPFALPILGHLHLFKKSLHRTLQSLSNRFGPMLYLQLGSRPVLVISSQSLIEECFSKNDIIFANRPFSFAGDHLTYNYSLFAFAPYGHHWRNMRRITTIEIFSSKSLQLTSTIRKEEIHSLVSHLFQSSNGGSQHFDLKIMFSKVMFNIIMRMVAGKRCFEESMDSEDQKRLHAHLKELFTPRAMLNIEDFLPILRWIGFCNEKKSLIKLQKMRDSFLQDLINEHRRRKNGSSTNSIADEKKKIGIIGALLSIQEAEPEQYSDDFIKGNILTLFTAGTDTTSLTMEWAMSLLLNHPDVLHKAHSEINNHIQGRLLEDSDLFKLPYLQCIINETLRLYPAAPLLVPHASSEDCTIGGYNVPRGTILFGNIWAIHRDPKVWLEPTKFMPERFESMKGEREMGFNFAPFGVGRRGCPGAGLAMRVVALGLGTLIQCFEWSRVGQQQVDMIGMDTGATMPKAEHLVAKCKPRPGMVNILSLV